jgi:hypothetical protein
MADNLKIIKVKTPKVNWFQLEHNMVTSLVIKLLRLLYINFCVWGGINAIRYLIIN